MTTGGRRQTLVQTLASAGWQHRRDERVDNYLRGATRVRVVWRGDDAISGGTLFSEEILMSYSRDLDTVTGWLTR